MSQEMPVEKIDPSDKQSSWRESLVEICVTLLFLAMGIRALLEGPPRV
jgi:hypothetical protein